MAAVLGGIVCLSLFVAVVSRSAARASCIASVKQSGAASADPETDSSFAAAMIAHHQSAVAMARAELRDGRNEQLRRLAQEIIITQQQEIAVMRLAISHPNTQTERRQR